MAANSKTATFGKRVVKQIWTTSASTSSAAPPPPAISFSLFRRSAHASVYDKNIDEHVRPAVVPDEVIQPESDKYWAPHPQTGVFGPATDQNSAAAAAADRDLSAAPANGGQGSLLEEKAWFRPTSLEDMEKPHHV